MTAAQAAEHLGVARSTIPRLVHAGRLTATKLPGLRGAFLIDAASVHDEQERRRVSS